MHESSSSRPIEINEYKLTRAGVVPEKTIICSKCGEKLKDWMEGILSAKALTDNLKK